MASTCPNCGKKLHFWNIKAECSACGVSIPNYDWEARLEEDNRNAEKAFGVFNRTLSRMAYSMWGTKLRIARLVLTFLPAVGFILPWSNIKGTGSSFVLSILSFDGSKSLIDFFKAFFGDVGLFTTTMGMEGYGGPVTLGVIGYFLFLLSALFIVIAFFMVLIRCKNSKTKTTIVFDVLSVAASVAAVICFTVGGQRGADLGAFSFGGNAALAPSGSIGWGYFVALLLLLVATGMNIARLVVEKWNDGGTDCVLNKNEVFWHHVPAQVAFTYTEDKDLVARAKALKAQGREACSLLYKPDLMWNPVRYACVLEQLRRQFKKFKTYYPVHK